MIWFIKLRKERDRFEVRKVDIAENISKNVGSSSSGVEEMEGTCEAHTEDMSEKSCWPRRKRGNVAAKLVVMRLAILRLPERFLAW